MTGLPQELEAPAPAPAGLICLPTNHAIGRALLVVAVVIASQTLGDGTIQHIRSQYPLAVASLCAFLLCCSSDCLAQVAASTSHTVMLDIHRMLRTGLTASFLSGFLAVYYFSWLERAVNPLDLGGADSLLARWLCVACKVAIDVGCYEPCYDTLYITIQALLRGQGLDVAMSEVRQKVLKVWAMAPRYWSFADAINFGLVPLRLRPMTNSLFSIPWGMHLSKMANARS